MISIAYLKSLAYEFRQALEDVVDERMYGRLTIFRSFPNGCCRYTSDLLAEYMMDNGIPPKCIQMVECESFEQEYTHCWLLIDNTYYVDISADQFNGKAYFKKYEPITGCCVISCDEKYLYERFDSEKMQYLQNVGINSYNGDIPMKLRTVYSAVVQKIDKIKEEK